MLGNDIVDLALARKESNWENKRYLNKILNQKEQNQLLNAPNKEAKLWELWTRKEACYKIYNRETQKRAYNPLQFECFKTRNKMGFIVGKVSCNSRIYYTKTQVTSEFVYTEALENERDFEVIKVISRSEKIYKKEGIPNYFDTVNNLEKPVSISHHGKYERIITLY